MSAKVAIMTADREYFYVDVPSANHAEVDLRGHLVLKTGGGGYTEGEHAGLFKQWDHVVIDQRWLRGPGGRFVSKENR